MRIGLDTSVALRLLVGEPEDQAQAARRAVDKHGGVASDLVVGETYYALRHHYAVSHALAISQLLALLRDEPRIVGSGVAARVLADAAGGGPGLLDRLIHADYGREDVLTYTFDREAARLEGARLVE